jgi:hypothetical protein
MVKSIGLLVVALALLLPILAGCGGSDAIGTTVIPPPVGTTRTISGKIARADTGAGLANVLVRLGSTDKTSTSGASGEFSFTVSKTEDIPVFIQVDTSSAGASYPPGNVVSYKSQNFLPTEIDIPVAVLNADTDVLGTISIYNASGDVPVPPPFASKNTIIVGQIVSKKTGAPIKDVTVRFGPDRFYSAISGTRGFFGVDLGRNVPVLTIYPTATGSFQVDTTTAGSAYPDTLTINYRSVEYDQSAVTVPVDVMTGEVTFLGTLSVIDDGSGGGGGPPPPPI